MTNLKTIILAVATVAATATTVSAAGNAFPIGETFEQTDTLALDFVRADAAGTVEIYDFHTGVRGELLGSEAVHAGVNTDVKVGLGRGARNDILAVLNVNGQEVLTKDLDIRN